MNLTFDPDFSNGAWPGPLRGREAVAGEEWVSPGRLAHVLSIALGVAYASAQLFDVSFALGAFFAGMVLAESELSHQAAAEVLPLRDAFAVLFFVSVGMLEHVGYKNYDHLAEVLARVVRRARGRGLLHFIARDVERPLNAWTRRRIFPAAYVPTLAEAGVADQEADTLQGVLVPAGTPKEIIDTLHREIVKIVALPDVKERLAGLGFDAVANRPDEFAAQIRAEIVKWGKVVKDAKITAG